MPKTKTTKVTVKKAPTAKPAPKKPHKPDPAAIKAQIAALRELKPKVRHSSGFGNDHHAAIDAQIEVLEDNLSQTEINDRTAFEDDDDYDDAEELGKWKMNVNEGATAAREWLDGELEDAEDIVGTWEDLLL